MLGITRKGEREKKKDKTENIIKSLHKSVVWSCAGQCLQFLCAPTLPSPQPRTHPKSQKRHRRWQESTGTIGQLLCKERTSVLGLTGCQERWQRRDRFAGLLGTSHGREQGALPAPVILKHLAPCS